MIVAGIDPSISGTSVCIGEHDSAKFTCVRFPTSFQGSHVHSRLKRYDQVISLIMEELEKAPPTVIVIEDYSYGSVGRTSELGEYGGLLRWHLDELGHLEEAAPATRLKFLTGSGKQPKGKTKQRVAESLLADFGVSFDSDDDADAFAYWQIAKAALADPNTLKPHQRECLKTVFGTRLITVRAKLAREGV